MYSFSSSATLTGTPQAIWATWTDVDSYPSWDPREERAHLHGPFAVGSTIDSKQTGNPGGTGTIVEVAPGSRWVATSPLPGGELRIDHTLTDLGDGRVEVVKTYDVTGPLSLAFRIWWGPRVTKALPASFAALEAETARRG